MEDTAGLANCPFCGSLRIRELGELYASKWVAERGESPREVQVSVSRCQACGRYFEGIPIGESR